MNFPADIWPKVLSLMEGDMTATTINTWGQARIHRALSPSVQAAEHVIEFQRNGVLHACRLLDFSVCCAGAVGKLPRPF